MKKVLSISVGSSSRDHTTKHKFLDQEVWLSRQGTTGDFEKAIELFRYYDGKVAAFGVGGLEFFLEVGNKKYPFRDYFLLTEAKIFGKMHKKGGG